MLRATANGWLDLVICNWDGQKDLPYRNLGDATIVERVIIEWPSGNVTQLTD